MVRPTDQETISTERTICYSQFPGGRGMPHHSGPRGEAPEFVRNQMSYHEPEAYLWFSWEGIGKVK